MKGPQIQGRPALPKPMHRYRFGSGGNDANFVRRVLPALPRDKTIDVFDRQTSRYLRVTPTQALALWREGKPCR